MRDNMKAKYLHAIVTQDRPEIIGYKKYLENASTLIEFIRTCDNREYLYYQRIDNALKGVK